MTMHKPSRLPKLATSRCACIVQHNAQHIHATSCIMLNVALSLFQTAVASALAQAQVNVSSTGMCFLLAAMCKHAHVTGQCSGYRACAGGTAQANVQSVATDVQTVGLRCVCACLYWNSTLWVLAAGM